MLSRCNENSRRMSADVHMFPKHLLLTVGTNGVACGGGSGLSGISSIRSLTSPLNLIPTWLSLAPGVQAIMTRNLGG